MERLQERKKQLQNEKTTAWENRLIAKTMSAEDFRNVLNG